MSPGVQEDNGIEEDAWWQTARIESALGILVRVENRDQKDGNVVTPTELLFFASKSHEAQACPPTPPRSSQGRTSMDEQDDSESPTIAIKAIALCSNLLSRVPTGDITPPPSPTLEQPERKGHFLPRFELPTKPAGEGHSHKRKSATTTLDEALDRRKRPKKAAAEKDPATTTKQPTRQPLQTRPLSRSPSLSNSLPPSRRASVTVETAQPPKKSTLSRVQSINDKPFNDQEQKNKDAISRAVMAGMRLYGLSQSKTRKAERKGPVMPTESETASKTEEEMRLEKENDEEFKLVYHQAYKGTCFAFRKHIESIDLKACTAALQESVDRLLVLFCSDILLGGGGEAGTGEDAKSTFGSAARTEASPWESTHNGNGNEVVAIPSLRRKGIARSTDTVKEP